MSELDNLLSKVVEIVNQKTLIGEEIDNLEQKIDKLENRITDVEKQLLQKVDKSEYTERNEKKLRDDYALDKRISNTQVSIATVVFFAILTVGCIGYILKYLYDKIHDILAIVYKIAQ